MRHLEKGLSAMSMAFPPGLELEDENICRTFQPSVVVMPDRTLLAFCQGRLREGRDDDPKVILVSASNDAGASWTPARRVSPPLMSYAMSAYLSRQDGRAVVSVLTMVDLRGTEDVYGKDYGRMLAQTGIDIEIVGRATPMILCRFDSADAGASWTTTPLSGTASPLNRPLAGGTPIMFNPIGQVHVMPAGPWQGRYIIGGPVTMVPAGTTIGNYFRDHPQSGSGIIYSDDGGRTWQAAGFINDYLANEASAVSLREGQELLIIRRFNGEKHFQRQAPLSDVRPGVNQRLAHTSDDCGKTWSPPFLLNMSHVLCHGTLARDAQRLLFSIPAGPEETTLAQPLKVSRCRGTIYFSDDEGKSWRHKLVEPETFSYSTVTPIGDGRYIALFARGSMGQDGIGCRGFDAAWLTT